MIAFPLLVVGIVGLGILDSTAATLPAPTACIAMEYNVTTSTVIV